MKSNKLIKDIVYCKNCCFKLINANKYIELGVGNINSSTAIVSLSTGFPIVNQLKEVLNKYDKDY